MSTLTPIGALTRNQVSVEENETVVDYVLKSRPVKVMQPPTLTLTQTPTQTPTCPPPSPHPPPTQPPTLPLTIPRTSAWPLTERVPLSPTRW